MSAPSAQDYACIGLELKCADVEIWDLFKFMIAFPFEAGARRVQESVGLLSYLQDF
jgi:hypothetical protein